jgi:hypothetical protein
MPSRGRKVFTLQTIAAWEDDFSSSQVGKVTGFSLHAGVATETRERKKLERLSRYITRSAIAVRPLSMAKRIRFSKLAFS